MAFCCHPNLGSLDSGRQRGPLLCSHKTLQSGTSNPAPVNDATHVLWGGAHAPWEGNRPNLPDALLLDPAGELLCVAVGAAELRLTCPHASVRQRHWCTWESSHQLGRLWKVQRSHLVLRPL